MGWGEKDEKIVGDREREKRQERRKERKDERGKIG
jgi:hypothetical protein